MSHTLSNHVVPDVLSDPGRAFAAHDEAELLDLVRANLVRVTSQVGRHPSSVRIAVGAVSMQVEWAPERTVVAAQEPAPATASPAAEAVREAAPAGPVLTAPTVGVFYRSPEPGAPPFLAEGEQVSVGQQIGIVEAMKLMIPVEADAAGVVTAVLKGDGEPVEYGEPLFALAPAG